MKKSTKIIIGVISVIALYFIIDFTCIFTINRPLFAKKINEYTYVGPFYKTYNCPEYSSIQITWKDAKLACATEEKPVPEKEEQNTNKGIKIVDTSLNNKDFICAQAIETFYEDDNFKYQFNCIKSGAVIVTYEDGTQENVKQALSSGKITIKDLDDNNIAYRVSHKK